MKPVGHFILVDGEYQQLAEKYCESPDAIPLYDSPQTAWIMCSDRMPDDGQMVVIVNAGHGEIYEAAVVSWRSPHFFLVDGLEAKNYDGGAVVTLKLEATHWMPLPAAPEDAHE